MKRLYDINCATAIHLEWFANIPSDLANNIVVYRKKRKRIRHIDELWRVRGITRKYFANLSKVFYVPNQVVPRIGEQLPYVNTISTMTMLKKPKERKTNVKKRKRKAQMWKDGKSKMRKDGKAKSRGHIKCLSEDSKRELISKKSCLESTKRQRFKSYNKMAKMLGKKNKRNENKLVNNVKQPNGTKQDNTDDSSESTDLFASTVQSKFKGIAEWITNIPTFSIGQHKVEHKEDNTPYSYFYHQWEKQHTPNKKFKMSSGIFLEEHLPKSAYRIDLYKNCTIL